MATMLEVWGFGSVLAVEVEIDEFCKAINREAKERGIAPHLPSDALDASRTLMIGDAAASLNARWEIVGDTMRLWRADLNIDWGTMA